MFYPSPRVQVSAIRPGKPKLRRIESYGNTTCTNTCRESFRQFLLNCTLHGLKYVGDRNITYFERTFFGLMFLLVFFLSVFFISNVWIKYSASPMIISLSSMSTDIRELPFPAVTICNMNQAVKSVVETIPKDSEDYSMTQSLCTDAVDTNVTNSKEGKWAAFQNEHKIEAVRRFFIHQVSQSCQDMLIKCIYGGITYNCTDIFLTVLTDEGLCCTFNGLNKKFIAQPKYNESHEFNISATLEAYANNWSAEKGFGSEELKNNKLGYPRPVAGTGTNLGLSIILDAGIAEYYCSSTNSYGFKFLLHSPNEVPMISTYGTSVSNGYESRVIITPTLSEATKKIRKMDVKVRQCLFEEENFLLYYRTYTRGNCQMECNAKIYLRQCNCILYYMPRFKDDITICGRSDEACIEKTTLQIQEHNNTELLCDCLPSCFEVTYDSEISMAPLLPQAPLLAKQGLLGPNVSVMHIFFKNNYFRSQRKDELIGFTEFLSNTGGLLGLFMGFSLFSFIEIFYFLTIRPFSNYIKVSENRQKVRRVVRKMKNLRTRKTSAFIKSHIEHTETLDNNLIYPYVRRM
ncbi:pickpocket protein 28-like [Contarinia nasturtii]|uniref:pickpocket protein 28-like n=1 Tax=Contarinia nasturtii TaxID=265458 RepID=UPI0012D3975D|nr:pickpocket protein 28-like [Contarinia nasturtii]